MNQEAVFTASSLHLAKNPASVQKSPLGILDSLQQWREMEEAGKKSPVRWRPESMPLRVFIDPYPGLSPGYANLPDELFTVLRQWEAAMPGHIQFANVSELPAMVDSADIVIRWCDEPVEGRDYEVGHANREVQGNRWIVRSDITLLTAPLIDRHLDPQRQRNRLHATILHEVGHALGLEHSENDRDVMHHRGWRNHLLSKHDIERLRQLYLKPAMNLKYS